MSVLPERETLHVEFKSDVDGLTDVELIAAVVCFANAEGGDLYLGVEDDGTPTGLHPRLQERHRDSQHHLHLHRQHSSQ